jgi:hypothetical protein
MAPKIRQVAAKWFQKLSRAFSKIRTGAVRPQEAAEGINIIGFG